MLLAAEHHCLMRMSISSLTDTWQISTSWVLSCSLDAGLAGIGAATSGLCQLVHQSIPVVRIDVCQQLRYTTLVNHICMFFVRLLASSLCELAHTNHSHSSTVAVSARFAACQHMPLKATQHEQHIS